MKIYFAGSICGGRQDQGLYQKLIKHLQKYGPVLTEHVGNRDLTSAGERSITDRQIHQRDLAWLKTADLVVAEVTTPSLGVGYELGIAEKLGKRTLCLYRLGSPQRLSAMISGNSRFQVVRYSTFEEAVNRIDAFLQTAPGTG